MMHGVYIVVRESRCIRGRMRKEWREKKVMMIKMIMTMIIVVKGGD